MRPVSRWHAFLVHLGISFAIFLILAYLIVFKWYPAPFFLADGGWQGIRVLASVALVIGPLLTLIVFKQGKRGLKFDLIVIGLMQAGAIVWGTWTVYHQRPIAMVYTLNYLTPVTIAQVRNAGLDPAKLSNFGDKPPVPIYSNIPIDIEGQKEYLIRSLSSRIPLYLFIELYSKFDSRSLAIVKQQSTQLYTWLESQQDGRLLLDEFYMFHPELVDRYLFIPLHSRYKRSVIVLDAHSLQYIGALDMNVSSYLTGEKKDQQNTKATQT